jgi:hypothetical protein
VVVKPCSKLAVETAESFNNNSGKQRYKRMLLRSMWSAAYEAVARVQIHA